MKYVDNKIVYEVGDLVVIISREYPDYNDKPREVLSVGGPGELNILLTHSSVREDYIRPATQEEINKALGNEPIMVGEYNVEFYRASKDGKCNFIQVGCQKVSEDLFLKIGKKAKWINWI